MRASRRDTGAKVQRQPSQDERTSSGEGLLPRIGAATREPSRWDSPSPDGRKDRKDGIRGAAHGRQGLTVDVEREPERRGDRRPIAKSTSWDFEQPWSRGGPSLPAFGRTGSGCSDPRGPDRSPESVARRSKPGLGSSSWGEQDEAKPARVHDFSPPKKIHIFVRDVPALPPKLMSVSWLAEAAAKDKEEGKGKPPKGKGKGRRGSQADSQGNGSPFISSAASNGREHPGGTHVPSSYAGRADPPHSPRSASPVTRMRGSAAEAAASLSKSLDPPALPPVLQRLPTQQPAPDPDADGLQAGGLAFSSESFASFESASLSYDGLSECGGGSEEEFDPSEDARVAGAAHKHSKDAHDVATSLERLRAKDKGLKEVLLRGSKLGDEGVAELAAAMRECLGLKKLDLAWNGVSAVGCKALCSAILTTKNLTCIILNKNQIGDKGACALAFVLKPEPMKPEPKIAKVELIGNQIGPAGATAIAEALMKNKKIKRLHMGGNNVGDLGAKPMSELVMKNVSLKQIFLDHNGITDKGAKMLAHAMKVNSKIDQLDLFNNEKIGEKGAKAIDNAMNNPIWFVRLPNQKTQAGVIASLTKDA